MKRFTLSFGLFLLSFLIFGENPPNLGPLNVDAGDDMIVCAPGQTVTLNGSVGAPFSCVAWTPAAGLSDPGSLTPDVFVSTTTTFTLTAFGQGALSNLIFNGDFEQGSTGFTSDYIPGTGGTFGLLSLEGQYAIASDPALTHSNFPSCPGSNMMVVNGAEIPGENIWCQSVVVTPNSVYEFSAWATSAHPSNPAILQFSINGVLLGNTFSLSSATCAWTNFFEKWESQGATTAEICIVNQNTIGSGNDFALDDISFGPVCAESDEVTVEVVEVMAFADPFAMIPCNNNGAGITLDGAGSTTGSNVDYLWTTTNGNIVSGANTLTPLINAPGIYELSVIIQGTFGPCESTATVEVLEEFPPEAVATTGNDIDCLSPTGIVLGTGSTIGPTVTYQWTTTDGFIISGENELIAEVGAGGTYTLTVTDIVSGCSTSAATTVTADLELPTAVADPNGNIDCNNTAVNIDGSGSTGSGPLTFLWTSPDGNITSDPTQDNIDVDTGGVYQLIVTNQNNGCTALELTNVSSNVDPPTIDIASPDTLDCNTNSFSLDASGSSGVGTISFLWSTADGNIVSGETTAMPAINQPGTYTLVITDDDNGCTATDNVLVEGDLVPPLIDIATPLELTCNTMQTTLDGSGSQAGVSFLWTSTDGNIVSGENTAQPTVNQTGTYTLTITDPDNGCTATEDMIVQADQSLPSVEAGPVVQLDCNSTTISLDGTGSATGANITYLWTYIPPTGGTGVGIISGETTLEPEVGSGGTYVLTVTNNTTGCTNTDQVVIPQNNDIPIAELNLNGQLNCLNNTLTIDGTASSSGTGFSLVWSTVDGNIVSGETTLEPVVNEAGTYVLTITNLTSNCTSTDEVIVEENLTTPIADPGNLATLTCTNDTLQLDGSASVLGLNDLIHWTTVDGEFAQGDSTLTPTITGPGEYILTITNPDSGCSNNAAVTIAEDTTTPDADAGNPMELTCIVTALNLDGSGSSQNGNYTYLWTTTNGNIVSGADGLSPNIDAAGSYLLTVLNNDNGCENNSPVEVTLNGDFPDADAGAPTTLTCEIIETSLNASGDMGSSFVYNWSTVDGNILSGGDSLSPLIGAPGTYQFTITNLDNGCSTTDEVLIPANTTLPTVDAGPTDELSCTETELMLNGSGNAVSNNISFNWSTANGNITANANTAMPTVNAAGTYWLVLTDNDNGCKDSSAVDITLDANVPIADAGQTDLLTCTINSLVLDGTASSNGADITYEWTTTDGNILSGDNTLSPEVNSPGTYLLTVTDELNNCQSIATVQVDENTIQPLTSAGPDGTLTCTTTNLLLDGSGSVNGPDYLYEWTTANGNLVADINTATPTVDATGLYELMITNTVTGCTNTATVAVIENITPPDIFIDPPLELTCEVISLSLNAENSSNSNGFNFNWTTVNGNIVSGENTLVPIVNEPGEYSLVITNNQNGCTATDLVSVDEDIALPLADAGPSFELDCNNLTLNLDATNSSNGNDFTYLWTYTPAPGNTGNGIIAGDNTLTPEVDGPGNYSLTVINEINGCLNTADVNITQDITEPVILIAPPAILTCLESEVLINADNSNSGSNFDVSWATSNGNIIDGQNTLQLTVDQAGDYSLTILNTDNGCSASSDVEILENIELPNVDAGAGIELHCNLTETALTGSTDLTNGQFTANWSTANGQILTGSQTLAPTINAPGIYQLTILNTATGCTNVDEVEITENILLDFNAEREDPTCTNPNGSILFTAVQGGASPFQYSVNNGQSFNSTTLFSNLPAGVYDLAVIDANGCQLSDVVLLADPPEINVSLEAQVVLQLGETYQLNALTSIPDSEIASIEWSPADDLSCSDCLSPIASPIQQSQYEVIVTSKDGCTASATTAIFLQKNIDIYVPNAFSPNSDGINDLFHIYSGSSGIAEINSFKIFSRWGESVFEQYNFPPNNPQHGWDGKHKGELMNPAVFVWWAEIELIDGTTKMVEGDVHLMR